MLSRLMTTGRILYIQIFKLKKMQKRGPFPIIKGHQPSTIPDGKEANNTLLYNGKPQISGDE